MSLSHRTSLLSWCGGKGLPSSYISVWSSTTRSWLRQPQRSPATAASPFSGAAVGRWRYTHKPRIIGGRPLTTDDRASECRSQNTRGVPTRSRDASPNLVPAPPMEVGNQRRNKVEKSVARDLTADTLRAPSTRGARVAVRRLFSALDDCDAPVSAAATAAAAGPRSPSAAARAVPVVLIKPDRDSVAAALGAELPIMASISLEAPFCKLIAARWAQVESSQREAKGFLCRLSK
mmetsp:Transcript_6/g.19  ORF Transcript_6/g.19 Transcript_6/m.19 type:complete len:234 (+) Transcript_6:1453-2154(+)